MCGAFSIMAMSYFYQEPGYHLYMHINWNGYKKKTQKIIRDEQTLMQFRMPFDTEKMPPLKVKPNSFLSPKPWGSYAPLKMLLMLGHFDWLWQPRHALQSGMSHAWGSLQIGMEWRLLGDRFIRDRFPCLRPLAINIKQKLFSFSKTYLCNTNHILYL